MAHTGFPTDALCFFMHWVTLIMHKFVKTYFLALTVFFTKTLQLSKSTNVNTRVNIPWWIRKEFTIRGNDIISDTYIYWKLGGQFYKLFVRAV